MIGKVGVGVFGFYTNCQVKFQPETDHRGEVIIHFRKRPGNTLDDLTVAVGIFTQKLLIHSEHGQVEKERQDSA